MLPLLFHLIQHPPWRARRIVVFVVITKEIAGYKRYEVVIGLASGVVAVVVLASVRQIGSKQKELHGAQYRRQYPEKQKVFGGYKQFQNIKRDGCQYNLSDTHVFFQKPQIPKHHKRRVIVGIFISAGKLVMFVVFARQEGKRIEHKQCSTQLPNPHIDPTVPRNRAVNGIVSRDEQAGVEMGEQHNQ